MPDTPLKSPPEKTSQFRIYTLGTVGANKPLDSQEIEFSPDEDNFFMDGELTDDAVSLNVSGKSAQGQSYEKTLTATATMTATWLPMGDTNRKTAPDVRRGDRVVIWQFADSDKYYWEKAKDNPKITKLETVIYAYSNVRKESEEVTADKSYYFEVSTHKKMVHLHTANNDGEPFAYDIQLNTAAGFFQLTDNIGNIVEVDSKNTKITVINADGTYVELDRRILNLFAPDDINMVAGRDITGKAGRNITMEAGSLMSDKAANIQTRANTTTNTVPATTNTGTQTTIGTTTTGGLMSVPTGGSSGGFSATGDGTINGSVVINGQVTAQVGNFPGGVNAPNV